jgi:Leucine-rich repeat (LRR) protein
MILFLFNSTLYYLATVIRNGLKWATKVWNYSPDMPCAISQPDHFVHRLEAVSHAGDGIIPEQIFSLMNLEWLKLSGTQLTKISPRIGTLQYLTHLDLSDNRIVDIPTELGNLKRLESLWLRGNLITTIIEVIRRLPNLKKCFIEGNPIPAAEIEQIQREFPHLKLRP